MCLVGILGLFLPEEMLWGSLLCWAAVGAGVLVVVGCNHCAPGPGAGADFSLQMDLNQTQRLWHSRVASSRAQLPAVTTMQHGFWEQSLRWDSHSAPSSSFMCFTWEMQGLLSSLKPWGKWIWAQAVTWHHT